ncbi:MAG: gamma carbonic anhydrase family protein [Salinisphaera sp.]|nr:gamma carbonic anhydrase family protein [Salinisphaera sp.]
MLYSLDERLPKFPEEGSFFVAENATVVGTVELEKDVSIWFNAVLRGDCDRIIVGAGSNVQDSAVLHTDPGFTLRIGREVTVGHQAMLHGCEIGDYSLIGIQAVILNGARIGRNCLIGAQALIPEGMEVPDNSLVLGSPGRIKRELSEQEQRMMAAGTQHYIANGRRFAKGLQPLSR